MNTRIRRAITAFGLATTLALGIAPAALAADATTPPEVPGPTITLESDVFACGMTEVPTTMTTTTPYAAWDEATATWTIESTVEVEYGTRPLMVGEDAGCESEPIAILGPPPIHPAYAETLGEPVAAPVAAPVVDKNAVKKAVATKKVTKKAVANKPVAKKVVATKVAKKAVVKKASVRGWSGMAATRASLALR